jgi:hypothetical protein
MRLLQTGVVLLVIALSLTCSLSRQAIFTDFTARTVSPIKYLDWGKFLCPGGKPAGPWPPKPPCSEGSRVNVRGMVYQHNIVSTDARMSGKMEFVFNADTDGFSKLGPGSGPLWGTAHMEVMKGTYPDWTSTGEVWKGNWTGNRNVSAVVAISKVKVVLHGNSGRIEGLKSEMNLYTNHNSPEIIDGRIFESRI